jgi:hypothetical protein
VRSCIQDTRPFAPRFDVYYGGMTDVGYTVDGDGHADRRHEAVPTIAGTVGGGRSRDVPGERARIA